MTRASVGLQGQRLETWGTLRVVGPVSVVAEHVICSVLWSEVGETLEEEPR